MLAAIQHGRIEVLEYCEQNGVVGQWHIPHMNTAAKYGQLEVMKWLSYHGCAFNAKTAVNAAKTNRFAVLKWLAAEDGLIIAKNLSDKACQSGNIALIEWLLNWQPLTSDAYTFAAQCGCVNVLQWLQDVRALPLPSYIDRRSISKIASRGHLEVLKWLQNKNRLSSINLQEVVIRGRKLPLCFYRWLIRTSSLDAAQHGQLEILKWVAKENNFLLAETGVELYAASWGHLDVLKWLRDEQGFRWNAQKIAEAARKHWYEEVARWATSSNSFLPELQKRIYSNDVSLNDSKRQKK